MGESKFTLEQAAVNTLRVLGAEAISNAQSGHTGIVLSAAPLVYSVYKTMNFDPSCGSWFNRDRFVMSAGHGSALLYATLSAFGFKNPAQKRTPYSKLFPLDLKNFRQLGSPLAGHPELNEAMGVDCSTGPLGQGLATAVGIALAEKKLAEKFNKPAFTVVDHRTFCLVGDGCLMEGVSYEACNLAAAWGLHKLIVLYDHNKITLDGKKSAADAEDVKIRFKAIGWNVLTVEDGNDEAMIQARIKRAMKFTNAPTIIICDTVIGYGSAVENSHKAHGSVLTMDEISKLRMRWDLIPKHFEMDADIREWFGQIAKKKTRNYRRWKNVLKNYGESYSELHTHLLELVDKPNQNLICESSGNAAAGRDMGHKMINHIAAQSARIIGGNADVASCTKAFLKYGDNIAYGVREFAMAAISNGLALHGYSPFCSTLLAFADYLRPAMRMSAFMKLPVTYIFSHDGFGNTQDGPTHQGLETIAAMRVIPDFDVYRPADETETAAIYEYVFETGRPAAIVLSRGDLAGSIISESRNCEDPKAILVASGTEVGLCLKAQKILGALGTFVNVISVPCLDHFIKKPDGLDKRVPVFAVEAGNSMPWWALYGRESLWGDVISVDEFGASGTESDIRKHFGFTPEQVADRVIKYLGKHQ